MHFDLQWKFCYFYVASWQRILWLNGKEMLKNIFVEVKNKFETAIGILKKEKITIDPEDPAAVSHYAKVMKTIREKWDSALTCSFYLTISSQHFVVLIMLCLQSFVHSTGQAYCRSPKTYYPPLKLRLRIFQMLGPIFWLWRK